MFELVAVVFGLGIAAQVLFWLIAGLLFPAFWIWMLVDAALRDTDEYPSAQTNEKIVWIVLMLVVQVAAVAYFVMVFRRQKRGERANEAPEAAPAAPVAPAPAAPVVG